MKKSILLLLVLSAISSGCASPSLEKKSQHASYSEIPLDVEGRSDMIGYGHIYQLLLGEFTIQSGDFLGSFDIYSRLARNSYDKKLLKKTLTLALLSTKYVEAYFLSKRICKLAKHYECYAQFTALAAKFRMVNEDFFRKSHIKSMLRETPQDFLRSISNNLAFVGTSASSYADVLTAFKSLDFFEGLSNEHSDIFAVLAIQAEDYNQAMKLILSYTKSQGLNLPLVKLLITKAEKNVAPHILSAWVSSIRQFYKEDRQLALWEALFLSELGDFEMAKKAIRKFYVRDRDDYQVAFSLALLELHSQRFKKAKDILGDLLLAGYAPNEVNFNMGRISEIDGRLDDALAHYKAVRSNAASQIYLASRLRLAFVLSKTNMLRESLSILSTLDSAYPSEFIQISLIKGDILVENGEHFEALDVLGRALKKSGFNFELLYARSLVAEKLGRIDIMETDLGKILEVDPNNVEALNALGYSLTNLTDRHSEALFFIEKAFNLMPDSYHILDSMGWVYFKLGRLDESMKYLRQAYSLFRDPEIAAHLIEVLWVGGMRKEATGLLENAMKEFPGDENLEGVTGRIFSK